MKYFDYLNLYLSLIKWEEKLNILLSFLIKDFMNPDSNFPNTNYKLRQFHCLKLSIILCHLHTKDFWLLFICYVYLNADTRHFLRFSFGAYFIYLFCPTITTTFSFCSFSSRRLLLSFQLFISSNLNNIGMFTI